MLFVPVVYLFKYTYKCLTWCNIFIWYLLKLEWYTTECRYPQWYSGFSAIFTHLFVLICLVRSLQRNNLLHYDWLLLVYLKKINFKNLTFFFLALKNTETPPFGLRVYSIPMDTHFWNLLDLSSLGSPLTYC